jgi:hypothetical protein
MKFSVHTGRSSSRLSLQSANHHMINVAAYILNLKQSREPRLFSFILVGLIAAGMR